MIYDVDTIARDIRVCIDQNMSSNALLLEEDVDTLSLDDIIRSKIEDAAISVEMQAPAYLLEQGHNFGDAVYWEEGLCGWVLLPRDFMRLLAFEMSDWERVVYTAIPTSDPAYALQSSRFDGIRGTAEKPVCAISVRPEGRVLEFYSCKSKEAYVRRGMYVPYPRVDRDGGIDISELCYRAVVYSAAAMTLISIGEAEKGAALDEISKKLLQ